MKVLSIAISHLFLSQSKNSNYYLKEVQFFHPKPDRKPFLLIKFPILIIKDTESYSNITAGQRKFRGFRIFVCLFV